MNLIVFLTAPSVYKENKFFYMWYVSCNKWINKDLPTYDIKFAKSKIWLIGFRQVKSVSN